MNDGPILDPQIVAEVARLSTAELLIEHDALSSPDRGVVLDNASTRLRRKIVMDEVGRRLISAVVADRDQAERTPPSATTTIEHAKLYLRAHMGEGVDCPACGRMVKMYRRRLGPSMASALLTLYRAHGTDFGRTTKLWSRLEDADGQKLRYWGLIEPHKTGPDGPRPDGETGVFRVTDHGAAFIMGHVSVQSHALTFDSRCFGLDGALISFAEALRSDGFDVTELMAERPWEPPSDNPSTLF